MRTTFPFALQCGVDEFEGNSKLLSEAPTVGPAIAKLQRLFSYLKHIPQEQSLRVIMQRRMVGPYHLMSLLFFFKAQKLTNTRKHSFQRRTKLRPAGTK